jgi:Ca-activated chloride channel family protein
LPKFLALLVAAALALLLAACDRQPPSTFSFVSGSENTVMEPIVQEFCKAHNTTCTFRYEGSLDIGLALQDPQGAAQDAVWPASSVWIDMFDAARKVTRMTSIAQMPVILGVRRSKAEELGWIGKDVHMTDILAAVKSGKLKFLMTSATQSNSGASAYLEMLASAIGSQQVLQSSDLANPTIRDTVGSLLGGVERSSGSSGWLADLYVQAADAGTSYDAMWNYEAILKETNDKLKAAGKEQLYAIYPADGVAIADSPLGFIDHGRGPDTEKFFTDLVAFLQTKPIAQRIADTGRRIPLADASIAAKPEPDWNFDPTRLVTAIRMPEPPVIRQALELYQEALRVPSLTALCLDFSGSMEGEGERQLQQAMQFLLDPQQTSQVLIQWKPDDQIIVIPFDQTVRTTLAATGQPEAQAALLNDIGSEAAGGGTDMYACASEALRQIQQTPNLSKYLPAIVIMTDGRSDDASDEFMAEWRQVPQHVPVFGITFGDADATQLKSLADNTQALVFDGKADLASAFRAARGYN